MNGIKTEYITLYYDLDKDEQKTLICRGVTVDDSRGVCISLQSNDKTINNIKFRDWALGRKFNFIVEITNQDGIKLSVITVLSAYVSDISVTDNKSYNFTFFADFYDMSSNYSYDVIDTIKQQTSQKLKQIIDDNIITALDFDNITEYAEKTYIVSDCDKAQISETSHIIQDNITKCISLQSEDFLI